MNSFIIVAKDQEKRTTYISSFCDEKQISPFDRTIIQTAEASIGIETIRNMQKNLFLKPFKGKEKALTIDQAELLTTEAQNALLKILEEPPANTYLFLASTTDKTFLPTILSRCKVVKLAEEKVALSEEKQEEIQNQLNVILSDSLGAKLALAEKLAGEKDALFTWFEEVMHELRNRMLQNPQESREVLILLEKLQRAYQTFQTTNANPRLLLEHTFLSL